MSQFRTILATAAAALALAGAAQAAPVTVRDNPNNGSSVFATGLGRTVSINHDGVSRNVGAGVFSLQHDTGGQWNDFLTFCLELDQWLTLPKQHTEVDGDAYFPNAVDRTALEILFGNFMTSGIGLKNSTTAAAMQTVIWEVIEDGAANFNLSSGTFKLLSSDVLGEANTLWTMILSGQYKAVSFNVFSATGTQDLLVNEVPIPGALWLFGSAVAGIGFSRRHKKAIAD